MSRQPVTPAGPLIRLLAITAALVTAAVSSSHTQTFTPVLEWSWTSTAVDPTSLNVMSTPSVIDLNGDGIADIVFGSTSSTGGGAVEIGVLRALSGDTGAELFTVTDPALRINTASSVATGDIDDDGRPEIIATDSTGARLIAFEHDGTFKWRSPPLEAVNWGAPAIADLNQDGTPEIVVGRQALSNAGTILWTGTGGRGDNGNVGPLSLVADVDLDGSPEIVAGNTIYSSTGVIERSAAVPDGFNAVANFDSDPQAEIVLVSDGTVRLFEHDLTVKWGPVAIPGGGAGGPPTIADFDNDGQVEIGVAGASRYAVFETNGTVKWAAVTQDGSSNRTGSSVFDFEADGSAEVVYHDETRLRVYRGSDGVVLFQTPLSSCTWLEYPLVADVDGDKNAEIVAVANNNCGFGPQRGVYVYGDPANTWVQTRAIWNQHTYHVTNIRANGTIPAVEQNNWQVPGLNHFRLNEFGQFESVKCDIDNDRDVDRHDINVIFTSRGQSAVPGDGRDADGDGVITVNDARACTLLCTRPKCADGTTNLPPVVTAVVPNAGQQGQSGLAVTITGQNTQFIQGTTTASLGLGVTVDSVTVTSATSLTAVISIAANGPLGARTVTVTTGSEVAALIDGFVVQAPVNQAPIVSAGANQTITLPSSALLSGTVSDDGLPFGSLLSGSWSVVSAPVTPEQTWLKTSPSGTLPTPFHSGTSVLFDPNTNSLIGFGGTTIPTSDATGEVWILSGANGLNANPSWKTLQPTGNGPARYSHSAVYDPGSNRLIVFGGIGPSYPHTNNDVWILTNANGTGGTPSWVQVTPVGSPPVARFGAGVAYDSATNRMIVVGGSIWAASGTYYSETNETWILTNANGTEPTPSTWISVTPTGSLPPGRSYPSVAYDAASNRLILFGGYVSFTPEGTLVSTTFNDTWVLTNANGVSGPAAWIQLTNDGASSSPAQRSSSMVAYNATSNTLTIGLGANCSGSPTSCPNLSDAWSMKNANGLGGPSSWTQLAPTGGPPNPVTGSAYDSRQRPTHRL